MSTQSVCIHYNAILYAACTAQSQLPYQNHGAILPL